MKLVTITTPPQEDNGQLGEDNVFDLLKEEDLAEIKEDNLVDCWGTPSDQEEIKDLVMGYNLDQ